MTEEQKNNERKIHNERESLVVKENTLIQHTRYDLSLSEQKILIYIISKIMADDKDFKHINFRIHDYIQVAGVKRGGSEYDYIKSSIKSLADKSWWVKNYNQKKGMYQEGLFRWIDTAEVSENSGEVDIVLSESLRPYLLDIRGNFTAFNLVNVLVLHSKYSIRLYEVFKSYLWLQRYEIDLQEFKKLLNIENKYSDYTELKRNVILPSIKEINKYTDLDIKFDAIKRGKKIDKLIFRISETKGYQMTMDLLLNQEERLAIKGKE